jgi:hypothetical protein
MSRICVFLYNDINGNAISETGELQIAGGAVSVTDRNGQVSLTNTTKAGKILYVLKISPKAHIT